MLCCPKLKKSLKYGIIYIEFIYVRLIKNTKEKKERGREYERFTKEII